ncbi:Uncharacterized protein AB751O23_AC_00360 [Chlamydiales bacterium SCGC AB-751-O23]|jgi:hypothetical protein|nr:Uncharacterized protein AB751O23_AC_00360 [Chlamydiales bacterium SCGC AB-751-O23]
MVAQKVKVKLFLGVRLTKDLEIHLSESSEWKSACAVKKNTEEELAIVHYEKKPYLGIFFDEESPSVEKIKKSEIFFFQKLHYYLPETKVRPLQLTVFSQVFIS